MMSLSVNPNPTNDITGQIGNVTQQSPPAPTKEERLSQAPEHFVTSFTAMNQMRAHSELCDITLVVDGNTLDAHKLVLASTSPYFYEMFKDNMLEHTLGIVRIHDMDVVAIKHLIGYMYTGELTITEQNVRVLLPASILLQLHSVREACCKLLLRQLHPTNCLGIRSLADAHSCKELHTSCHKYVLQNFEQVVAAEEFLLLPFEEVRDLISNNLLNICREETRVHSILVWIKHDLDSRQKHIAELMTHVRLPLVSPKFLITRVEREPLIRDDPQCEELLMEAMKHHLTQSVMGSERDQERQSDSMKPYVFAVGGYGGDKLNECEVYNPRVNAWSTIAPMISRRDGSGVTTLHKSLFVMGGVDGSQYLDTSECYNPLTNKWSYITPMGSKRWGLGACTFDGLIYVAGGDDGSTFLNSTERYDHLTAIWTSFQPMNTHRMFCNLAVLDNCIYCCGGIDSSKNRLSSVERFDPRIGSWYLVPNMTSRRNELGVASYDGFLYCIGGSDGSKTTSSGERYNPRTNTWEPIADMRFGRSSHGLVEVEGCLYALGGYNDSSNLVSVERYDIHLNKWTILNTMMKTRVEFGAAVLNCFDLERGLV